MNDREVTLSPLNAPDWVLTKALERRFRQEDVPSDSIEEVVRCLPPEVCNSILIQLVKSEFNDSDLGAFALFLVENCPQVVRLLVQEDIVLEGEDVIRYKEEMRSDG